MALATTGPSNASGSPAATPEARLVLAVALLETRDGGAALDELRAIADARPDWRTARLTLAAALLRRGLVEEAAREYTRVLGEDLADELAAGGSGLPDRGDVRREPEQGDDSWLTSELLDALLGLAICEDELGSVRRADGLYRAYADRTGITSPGAARAFYRLAAMFERTRVPWGDPEAERARALALDPDAAESATLPALPDPATDPVTEPYTRPIEFIGTPAGPGDAAAPADTSAAADTNAPAVPRAEPPVLVVYAAPGGRPAATTTETLAVELLVGPEGTVEDVRVDECDRLRCDDAVAVAFAAARWRFLPATIDGEPVAARVRFPVPLPGEGAVTEADDPAEGAAPQPDDPVEGAAPTTDEPRPERPGPRGGRGEGP